MAQGRCGSPRNATEYLEYPDHSTNIVTRQGWGLEAPVGCLLGIITITNLGIFALNTKTNTSVHSSLAAENIYF